MTTPAELTTAITTVTAEWLASGRVSTVRQIGDGHCYDFAEEVLTRLGRHDLYGYGYDPVKASLQEARTEDFWLDDFCADMALVRASGETIPEGVPEAVATDIISTATHAWLVLDGRHYDATAPEGRDGFLEMPFFADQFAGWRKESAAP